MPFIQINEKKKFNIKTTETAFVVIYVYLVCELYACIGKNTDHMTEVIRVFDIPKRIHKQTQMHTN